MLSGQEGDKSLRGSTPWASVVRCPNRGPVWLLWCSWVPRRSLWCSWVLAEQAVAQPPKLLAWVIIALCPSAISGIQPIPLQTVFSCAVISAQHFVVLNLATPFKFKGYDHAILCWLSATLHHITSRPSSTVPIQSTHIHLYPSWPVYPERAVESFSSQI